jgi:hypothetical protein
MELVGQVERRVVAKGTRSERSAVVLVAPSGEFILRRAQGNPFVDDVLESLVGRQVACEGVMLAGSTFEARTVNPVDAPPKSLPPS